MSARPVAVRVEPSTSGHQTNEKHIPFVLCVEFDIEVLRTCRELRPRIVVVPLPCGRILYHPCVTIYDAKSNMGMLYR